MIIGVAKEIKTEEYRVGLLPGQAGILKKKGHGIMVESGAGLMAGFTDSMYLEKGAEIVSRKRLYKYSDMILKVKCPLESEYGNFRNNQILFTFLHFDENISAENIEKIVSGKITAIAYEWVIEKGEPVLLKPMSEITGVLFALQSMKLLMENKGKLPVGFIKDIQNPSALIIGMGRIGTNALRVFLANGMHVTVIEKNTANIEAKAFRYIDRDLWKITEKNRKIIPFDTVNPSNTIEAISRLLPACDIVLNCAVRSEDMPKSRMEYLFTRKMLSSMKKGSVLCDATACDRDMIETSVSSERMQESYKVDGIIHYSCDHIPSLVPNTSSSMLSAGTFPYVQTLADMGFENAVRQKESLYRAVMCHKGRLTHDLTANKKKMKWTSLESLL